MITTLHSSARALPFVSEHTNTPAEDWTLTPPLELASLESQGLVSKYSFTHTDGRKAIACQYSWSGPYIVTVDEK